MNLKYLLNKAKMAAIKHSPEILMVVGVGGTATAAVLACRATAKKVVPRKQQHEDVLDSIAWDEANDCITEEDTKLVKKECRSYALDVAKAYAVPVLVEVGSVACILASNNIMRKRLAGVTATLSMTMSAFEAYRDRVRERYGDEEEMSIYLNEKKIEIEKTDEKGKTKKETITVADPDISSVGRFLTKKNGNFSLSEAYMDNVISLKDQYLTDKLRSNGFITLNEIYYEWDFQTDTTAGITVGIVDSPECNKFVHTSWKKTTVLDEWGNPEDAYYLDWPDLEIIYGKGAKHRSIEA